MTIDREELARRVADRPPGRRTALEGVRDNYSDMLAMRGRGISWAEIAEVLARRGVVSRDDTPLPVIALRSAFFQVAAERPACGQVAAEPPASRQPASGVTTSEAGSGAAAGGAELCERLDSRGGRTDTPAAALPEPVGQAVVEHRVVVENQDMPPAKVADPGAHQVGLAPPVAVVAAAPVVPAAAPAVGAQAPVQRRWSVDTAMKWDWTMRHGD